MTRLTTLAFMENELLKHKRNLQIQAERNAPNSDIICIKDKIKHYEKVCEVLRKEEENATIER